MKNKKKNLLRVSPVFEYDLAKYPSHLDPDPTQHPAPLPFPFSKKLLTAVAGLGLGAGCVADAVASFTPPPKKAKTKPAPKLVVKENPLPFTKLGLPHRSSPYGTGQPSYLDAERAREIIDGVFDEEGLKITKRAPFSGHGVAFTADGYDAEQRIGYVIADWTSLDGTAIESWSGDGAPDDESHLSLKEIKTLEEKAEAGETHVAIVSIFDSRFYVNAWDDEQTRAAYKAVEALPQDERRAAYERINQEAAEKALGRLEQAVREYIAWARRQGI